MELHNLKPAKGSIKREGKRLGRGEGSGKGGTSTKGHKGQQSRAGYSKKIGFEGGQMPMQRRLPKFGFKNINRVEFIALNIQKLQEIAEKKSLSVITIQTLIDNGIANKNDKIKILAKGELKAKIEIEAHACSKKAKEIIENLQGNITIVK